MPKAPGPPPREDPLLDADAQRAAANELEEVERALSVLQGKNPEELTRLRQARTRAEANFRELAERIAANKARAQRARQRERVQSVIRALIALGVTGVIGAAGLVGYRQRTHWVAVDKALDEVAAPYVARGFAALRPRAASANRVEVQTDAAMCVVAIGVAEHGTAHLRVDLQSDVAEGDRVVAWCSCGPQTIAVAGSAGEGDAVGIRVLAQPATSVGGSLALPYLEPQPVAYGGEAVECSAEHLDAWIAARRYPKAAPGKWFEEKPERAALVRAGATMVGRAGPTLPFVVAEGVPDGCYVAFGNAPDDELSLRIDGQRPLEHTRGPIAWCDAKGGSSTVWRAGGGEVIVIGAPSRRVGGILGTRELAMRAGLGEVTPWIRAADLAKDASDAMLASGVVDTAVFTPAPAAVRPRQARVIALSVLEGGTISVDPGSNVPFACAPALGQGTSQAICVQSDAQLWRQVGSGRLGAGVEGAMPFWMSIVAPTPSDARAMALQLSLLKLARRLSAEGFEPSVLQGVLELPRGAEITGRGGEDAIVAVGMTSKPLAVYPMTDGETWTLEGEPHAIELRAQQRVTVMPTTAINAPPAERRTVVFRRHESSTTP